MKKAKSREVFAETGVFWDIRRYPIPLGFDARMVRPCIKHVLEKHGFRGPVTIFAVGVLTNVDDDILRDLCTSGIHLRYAPFGCSSILIQERMVSWREEEDSLNVADVEVLKNLIGGEGANDVVLLTIDDAEG